MPETSPAGVVVGVDGAAPSIPALRWAATEAALRQTDLAVVMVGADIVVAPYAPVRPEPAEQRRADLRRALGAAVTAAVGPHPPVVVHQYVEEGRPAEILARYAQGADLLVLGNRTTGQTASSLAPTIRGCIRRATCHIVVVRDEDGDAATFRAHGAPERPTRRPSKAIA